MFKSKKFEKYAPTFKKYAPAVLLVGGTLVAGTAFADVAADIDTAINSGKEIVEKAAGGLILIAAGVAGVALVVALLKR